MSEHDSVRRLAARLARDETIDWDAEERAAADEEQRAVIHQLRLMAAMAGFYRAVPDLGPREDLFDSVSVARSIAGPGDHGAGSGRRGGVGAAESAASDVTSAPALSPGSRWGQLEILERIGRGAFGEVYRARDTRLDREVALKLLTADSSARSEERIREARLLAKVRHQNVVTVHGADRIDGRVGIWMEFLRGETLDRILAVRGMLDAREAALIGIDLCRALSAVHAAGIIHQDVKLANIMRAEGGRIVLMDFGLGRETIARDRSPERRSLSGTPLFMAPETLRGAVANVRSDVYSLGVVLFALVTRAFPVVASTLSDLMVEHERGAIKHARDIRPDLPESFAHVLDRLLSAEPENRLATPGEVERSLLRSLGAEVEAGRSESPALSRRWVRTIALVSTGMLALAAAFAWRALPVSRGPDKPSEVRFSDVPSLTLTGEREGDYYGTVAFVGDVDQNGFGDLLVGAPFASDAAPYEGKVYLYSGAAAGPDSSPAWTALGGFEHGCLGMSIASVTNLSFDGFADLVIGASGSFNASETGRVVIFQGSRAGPGPEPTQVLSSHERGTLYGYAVATGDVDHDGDDDLLVGEPWFPSKESPSGRALLYLAEAGRYREAPVWIATGPPAAEFGITVHMGGDVNNDGFLDAVVGARSAAVGLDGGGSGAAFLYLGSATGLDSVPTVFPGRQPGSWAGQSVLLPGDLDGDGYGDLMVGAELASNGEAGEGIVEIYFGSKTGIRPYGATLLECDRAGANFGGQLGSLGDIDGDGCSEFLIGAIRYQDTAPREGAAFVFRGSPRREFERIWFRAGGKVGSWYGTFARAAGDLNGDALTDLVIAAIVWDSAFGMNVGRVDIFLQRAEP